MVYIETHKAEGDMSFSQGIYATSHNTRVVYTVSGIQNGCHIPLPENHQRGIWDHIPLRVGQTHHQIITRDVSEYRVHLHANRCCRLYCDALHLGPTVLFSGGNFSLIANPKN